MAPSAPSSIFNVPRNNFTTHASYDLLRFQSSRSDKYPVLIFPHSAPLTRPLVRCRRYISTVILQPTGLGAFRTLIPDSSRLIVSIAQSARALLSWADSWRCSWVWASCASITNSRVEAMFFRAGSFWSWLSPNWLWSICFYFYTSLEVVIGQQVGTLNFIYGFLWGGIHRLTWHLGLPHCTLSFVKSLKQCGFRIRT